jgi:hypothetical protein
MMTRFRTTKVQSNDTTTIPLFWFVKADKEQRTSTESALDKVIDQLIKEKPELKKKRIVGVPWLRNYTASAADVFATARGFDMGEGHVLGIDKESLENGTLLVLHCVNEKEPEIGRAAREYAVSVLLKEQLYKYTLAEAFDGYSWTEVPIPLQSLEPTVEDNDLECTLPLHLSDVKLHEDKIVLFSLIKLTDEEVAVLKQDMGDAEDEITIYNWPHETPASQAETYIIFQRVKPEGLVHLSQTFVMFIDATHISRPQRAPIVVMACESTPEGTSDGSRATRLELMRYKYIYLRPERAQRVKTLWRLIWNPSSRGKVNDVAVNYPLLYGSIHCYNDATISVTDRDDPVVRYQRSFIAKPGYAICATGATSPDCVVFILCPVTPEEIRILRSILADQYSDVPQFIELSLISREAGAEPKLDPSKQQSTDYSTRLDPLLEFFDTPAYRAIADPPDTFAFLDNDALDNLILGASKNASIPVATTYHYFHGNELIAVEEPAYLFANITIADGLESTLANLNVANMWFWELVDCYGDGLNVAFWPEYRRSMSREMLDIEWV